MRGRRTTSVSLLIMGTSLLVAATGPVTVTMKNGTTTRVPDVRADFEASGQWVGGSPPRRVGDKLWVAIEGRDGGAAWNDRIEITLSQVRTLSFRGEWRCGESGGNRAILDVQFRDGREATFGLKEPSTKPYFEYIYQSKARGGTAVKEVPLESWRLEGERFADSRGRGATSWVRGLTGRAPNPLGRIGDTLFPLCEMSTLRFEEGR